MNVLCIDQFSTVGGGQRSLLDLMAAFSEREWRPSLATPGDGPFPEMVRKLGYRTYHFTCGSYASQKKPFSELVRYAFEFPHLVNSLEELVTGGETDLIYVNGARLVPPAAWVAWRKHIPLVFHCHNHLIQYSAITLTGLALELASAHVIACCEYAADPLREYVLPERLRILYNGTVDMGRYRSRPAAQIRRIGVVGRVEREKGQMQFVEAARLVSQQVPECRFSIVGAPMFSSSDYYKKVVTASTGLPIDFIDWQEDMSKVYAELDLLVVPSTPVEATTRVILEAYSSGVPVLALPSGGIPEILKDEHTGFLAHALSAEALAQRIVSVMRMDASRIHEVVRKARKEWESRFTLEIYRDGVCSVLSEAMLPRTQSQESPDASKDTAATYSG